MVVQFALENNGADMRHPVKKKYLVARNRELKSSIFDYVHLSSTLSRKVRYGQSLDAALQTRSPWSNDLPSPGISSHARGLPKPSSKKSAIPLTKRQPVNTNQDEGKDDAIRYGRQIQLQAIDGGYLAVDGGGCLIKLPKSHRRDPATLLTLFPQDPLDAPGSKTRVSVGEQLFIVLGAATIAMHHELQYADAKKMYEPPKVLREAVLRHRHEHGNVLGPHYLTSASRGGQSTVWSFRTKQVGSAHKALENGMLVQLTHRNLTLHYEIERIVKKKYAPITSGGPETVETDELDPVSPVEESNDVATPSTMADLNDHSRQPRSAQTAGYNQVWLQRNDISSQNDPLGSKATTQRQKRWDNLWFLVDVATGHHRENEQKRRQAEFEAELESELRQQQDLDERNEMDAGVDETQDDDVGELQECIENNGDDSMSHTSKRMSVMNAHIFISKTAEETQCHAAAIIVRFLRRIFRREAERRANDLIDRRIRRTGKHHRRGGVDECNLSTMQQLRVLQCFKPTVYGSQRVQEPSVPLSRRIPGLSLQGSKYPGQEAHRLALMRRDLHHLGSDDFKVHSGVSQSSSRQHTSQSRVDQSILISNLKNRHNFVMFDRERERKYHVQLAMTHHEKPPFRFGKTELRNVSFQHHLRQQSASSPKPYT